MKTIELKNEELEGHLTSVLDMFLNEQVIKLSTKWRERERKDDLIKLDPTSDEYLFAAFNQKLEDYAHPRAILGAQLLELQDTGLKIFPVLEKRIRSLGKFLGPSMNALSVIYPEDGYIGWHHNGDYPGYNILFSYSQDGDGSFNYWDYETKSIHKIQDVPGWNIKAGYYPSQKTERDNVYWHMAKTKKPRVSIAFILENESAWKDMLAKIAT